MSEIDRAEQAPGLDVLDLRRALGTFATGVTIVTTRTRDGIDLGLTVNSFSSVSLHPPLVLWSLARASRSLPAFRATGVFAVHVLSGEQRELALRFARNTGERFSGLAITRGHADLPLLENCAARFECRVVQLYNGGDHEIFLGEVLRYEHALKPPLIFHGGDFLTAPVSRAVD